MTGALRRLSAVPWRVVLLASYVIINLVVLAGSLRLGPHVSTDWVVFSALADGIANGTVYDSGLRVPFVWSPVMAWIMAGVVAVGYWPWVAAHIASVFLLRNPLVVCLALVSYAFWLDTAEGNTVTFAFVSGAMAMSGSRAAAIAFLGLLLLTPRPIMLPTAAWLLWHDRSLWRPFAAIFAAHSILVLASGLAVPWIHTMVGYEGPIDVSLGPTAWLGRWWLLAGVPIAMWLALRGWVGWAGAAASPYFLHQYLIWPLIDIRGVTLKTLISNRNRSNPTIRTGGAHRTDQLEPT